MTNNVSIEKRFTFQTRGTAVPQPSLLVNQKHRNFFTENVAPAEVINVVSSYKIGTHEDSKTFALDEVSSRNPELIPMQPKMSLFSMKTDQRQVDSISEIAGDLVCQLASTMPKVTHLEDNPIPKRDSLVETINLLRTVLFPGYLQNEKGAGDLHQYLENKISTLADMLGTQISQALVLDRRFANTSTSPHVCSQIDEPKILPGDQILLEKGRELALTFLADLPQIRACLVTDVEAAFDGDPACKNLFEVVLCYPGIMAITVHRLAHQLYKMKVPFLPRMMAEWVHGETGIDIHPGARIGRHFFIDHGTGVVIGETCEIGEHVKIYQGVTLGALSFAKDAEGHLVRDTKRHPTLEDNVVIYANATVLGGQTVIGHDSVIGSSVWLTHSVDPFTTVTMEKPKLRLRNETPSDFELPLDYQI